MCKHCKAQSSAQRTLIVRSLESRLWATPSSTGRSGISSPSVSSSGSEFAGAMRRCLRCCCRGRPRLRLFVPCVRLLPLGGGGDASLGSASLVCGYRHANERLADEHIAETCESPVLVSTEWATRSERLNPRAGMTAAETDGVDVSAGPRDYRQVHRHSGMFPGMSRNYLVWSSLLL